MAPRFAPAISSQSLGRAPHHGIEEKLALCAQYGFKAIELFMEDLELLADNMQQSFDQVQDTKLPNASRDDVLISAARHIHTRCVQHKLEVLCLQPFSNFAGLLSLESRQQRLQELRLWIRIAQTLDTDLIQIPSNYLPTSQCTGDRARVVADLQAAADIGLEYQPPIRFAHEALAWGTHTDRWDQAWDIVHAVDRPNFGTCLDTFNLLGREYADPSSPDGLTPTAHQDLPHTLHKLRTQLDPRKVFYIEACDGERLSSPLDSTHEFFHPDQPARMSWSRNARLFPLEQNGYLPVLETLQAIVDAGYVGPVSFELFSRTAHDPSPDVPLEHARRAQRSWRGLCDAMGWEREEEEEEDSEKIDDDVTVEMSSQGRERQQQQQQQPQQQKRPGSGFPSNASVKATATIDDTPVADPSTTPQVTRWTSPLLQAH